MIRGHSCPRSKNRLGSKFDSAPRFRQFDELKLTEIDTESTELTTRKLRCTKSSNIEISPTQQREAFCTQLYFESPSSVNESVAYVVLLS